MGWSFGCRPASAMSWLPHASMSMAGRVIMLDDRTSSPLVHPVLTFQNVLRNPIKVLISTLAPMRCRHADTQVFMCSIDSTSVAPCTMDNDQVVNERRALYTISSVLYMFPDTQHTTMGFDHAWDITRMIRAAGLVNDIATIDQTVARIPARTDDDACADGG